MNLRKSYLESILSRSSLRRKSQLVVGALVAGAGLVRADGGDAPSSDAQQAAYRSGVAQESVRTRSGQIRDDLAQIVAELKMNGMSSDDIALLTQASTRLANLSQDEMQKVIVALQNASITQENNQRQQALAGAYEGQKDVSLKLKSLAAELSAQQAQNELPTQLRILIARQSANIRKTTVLRDSTRQLVYFNDEEKSLHTMAGSEQTAIGGEIGVLLKALSQTAAGPASDPATAIAKTAYDTMSGSMLQTVIPMATQLTVSGQFPDAVTKQVSVRNYLMGVLQTLLAKEDAATRLNQAKTQLDQIMADQKDLANATQQSKLDGSTLAERQNKIADVTNLAQSLLKPLNTPAAAQLDAAQKAMDQNAAALPQAKSAADTAAQQAQIAQALDNAKKLLDQQVAAMQNAQNQSPTDRLASLQKLQDTLNQAQQKDKTDPQSAAKDLQQVQQDNLGQVPPSVADNVSNALSKLNQPQPDADAANKELAQAVDALQQQQAAQAKGAQDFKALQDADQQLAQAEKDASAADQSLSANPTGDLTGAAKALTQAQNGVGKVAQTPPSNMPGDAKKALADASDALKDATNNAVQAKGGEASAGAKKGLAAIKQARASLGQAMASADASARQQANASSSSSQGQSQAMFGALSGSGTQQLIAGGGGAGGGPGQVVGKLQPKDRDALTQYQAEKADPDYAPQVQQYLKNLADFGGK
jgi:hypothetical protein